MKKEIENLINSWAEKVKPHKHEWELLDKVVMTDRLNPGYQNIKWTYFCKGCGEHKVFEN